MDYLKLYSVLEELGSGSLKQYCKDRNITYRTLSRRFTRAGIKITGRIPPVDPVVLRKLIDHFEDGKSLRSFCDENGYGYNRMINRLNRAGLQSKYYWSEFKKWEEYIDEWS